MRNSFTVDTNIEGAQGNRQAVLTEVNIFNRKKVSIFAKYKKEGKKIEKENIR